MAEFSHEAKRLKIVFAEFNDTIEAFSLYFDVHRSSMSRMLSGKTPITLNIARNVCFNLGYSPEWFIMGTGPKKAELQEVSPNGDLGILKVDIQILSRKIRVLEVQIQAQEYNSSFLLNDIKELQEKLGIAKNRGSLSIKIDH